jgi:RNA polymerase sigma-70 factor (ECF subfamily)
MADDAKPKLTFDEHGLVERIQSGRTALFAELIGRYQNRLYNLAYRLTGSPEDAADLSQETFARALKSISQFRHDAHFSTWLTRIMINITNDWKAQNRRERDQRENLQALLQRSQAAEMVSRSDPQLRAENREMVTLFWQAMDVLDLKYKQVLLLRDIEQLSYDEMAQILKISPGTVKSRLFRAREELRELLSPVLQPRAGEEQ